MASTTITLKDEADANISYDLVGQSPTGAVYRDSTRSLGLPRSLNFNFAVGAPGAKGNDRITCKLSNSVQNSETGLVSTGSVTVVLSVPRDESWTIQMSQDMLIQLQDLFADASAITIAAAQVP
jgi:hypothetical protein